MIHETHFHWKNYWQLVHGISLYERHKVVASPCLRAQAWMRCCQAIGTCMKSKVRMPTYLYNTQIYKYSHQYMYLFLYVQRCFAFSVAIFNVFLETQTLVKLGNQLFCFMFIRSCKLISCTIDFGNLIKWDGLFIYFNTSRMTIYIPRELIFYSPLQS